MTKLASEWDFFPTSVRAKVAELVSSAVDAYYDLARPERDDIEGMKAADLAPPLPPRPGRPAQPEVDKLVSGLAYLYANITEQLGARSADGAANPTDFERLVAGVFRVIGIEKSARAAVKRHVKARNRLPDEFNGDFL